MNVFSLSTEMILSHVVSTEVVGGPVLDQVFPVSGPRSSVCSRVFYVLVTAPDSQAAPLSGRTFLLCSVYR